MSNKKKIRNILFVLINTFNVIYAEAAQTNPINENEYINNDGTFNFYIEIPAGSKKKWEVNKKTGLLDLEKRNGKPRIINFISYPGNYGFIPQTTVDDGDPIDVIDLDEATERGNIKKINIIGGLYFKDKKKEDIKLIAIGVNSNLKKYKTISQILIEKPTIITIIKEWFRSYKKPGKMIFYKFISKEDAIKIVQEAHQKWKGNNKSN
jgi:inorganic pyrophosphatase